MISLKSGKSVLHYTKKYKNIYAYLIISYLQGKRNSSLSPWDSIYLFLAVQLCLVHSSYSYNKNKIPYDTSHTNV